MGAGASTSSAPLECWEKRPGPLHGVSAGTVPVKNYDVFINHRGPDVKKGFVSHLVERLKTVGFSCTFVDYEGIQPGDPARETIKSAILHSKIHIAIFSPGYVESAWCLDELLSIMECFHNKSTELFLPVLFNVTPSDLRSPMLSREGCYNESFDGLAEKFDATTISNWKKALHDAADDKGYIFPDDFQGYEAKLVGSIVSRVIEVLSGSTLLQGPEHPIGLDDILWEALTCMDQGIQRGCRIRTFGIYGMGGMGKTTLAKSIYNRIHREFESACFIQNVPERCKTRGFDGLQQDMLQELLKTREICITSTALGKTLMQKHLKSKKVLIILDDVSTTKQLDELMPRDDCWLGEGSQIVITTRDQKVLECARVKARLPMEGLSTELALKLFQAHAFCSTDRESSIDLKQLQTKVVDACQGLPLALEILGSYLQDKDIRRWEATVKLLANNKMGYPMQSGVTEVLKISYDALCLAEKDMFLDIACFMFQVPKGKAMWIWRSEFGDAEAEQYLETLIDKCLVKLDQNGDLMIHDLLLDMGRQIVDNSHKDHWKRSHLWRPEDVENVLKKRKAGTSRVRGLSSKVKKEWDTASFTGMEELRLLDFNSDTLTGDFGGILQELRWFKWSNCPLDRFPPPGLHLDKVVVLDLEESALTSFSCADYGLQNLRELNLNYCSNLVELVIDFSKSFKSLEILRLHGCVNLEQIPVSNCELSSSLRYLDVSQCGKLTSLPDHAIEKLITEFDNFELDGVGLSTLPKSFGSLSSLKTVRLHQCSNLRELPTTIGNLVNLVHLRISNCGAVSQLPESIGQLTRLEKLQLRFMVGLVSLPDTFSSLSALKVLNLKGCSNLCEIRMLPSSLVSLAVGGCTSLKFLDMSKCSSLEAVPSGMEDLCNLSHLDFSGCGQTPSEVLVLSVSSLRKLTSLKTLNLSNSDVLLDENDNTPWIQEMFSLEEVLLPIFHHRQIEGTLNMGSTLETKVPESFDVTACSGVVCFLVEMVHASVHDVGASYRCPTLEVVGTDEADPKFSQALLGLFLMAKVHVHLAIYRATHPLVASLRGGDTIRVRHAHAQMVEGGYVKIMYGKHEMPRNLRDIELLNYEYHGHEEQISKALLYREVREFIERVRNSQWIERKEENPYTTTKRVIGNYY